MTEGIYLEQDGQLVNMMATPYASEDLLQALLERHSVLLAGDQLTPTLEARRFVLIRREAGIPDAADAGDRWSIDHVFVDQDGIPTLIEVKRSTDTRIRREVIGQMLDYAANAVVYWPVERLVRELDATWVHHDGGGFEQLRTLLGLQDKSVDEAAAEIEAFWQQVASNLSAGRVRLLFIADILPPELRRVIEFLNEQMSPADVLGIEIRNYEGEGLRALVPRVVGLTEAAKEHKRQATTSSASIEELWELASDEVTECRRLLDGWATNLGLEQQDLNKSRRYAWPGATKALVLLYPGEYRAAYFAISAITDLQIADQLHGVLCRVAGKQLSRKEPGLACGFVTSHWDELREQFLTPLAEAVASGVRGVVG